MVSDSNDEAGHDVIKDQETSGKDQKHERTANLLAGIALLVSIVSLVFTGYVSFHQIRVQQDALALQREDLQEAIRQFRIESGVVELDAEVNFFDRESNTWRHSRGDLSYGGARLNYEAFGDGEFWIAAYARNIGQSPVTIDDAGVLLSPDDKDPEGRSVRCGPVASDQIPGCTFPFQVPPQSEYEIQISINDLSDLLTCNEYVESSGLVAAVKLLDGTIVFAPTTTFVPFSNDCTGPAQPPSK